MIQMNTQRGHSGLYFSYFALINYWQEIFYGRTSQKNWFLFKKEQNKTFPVLMLGCYRWHISLPVVLHIHVWLPEIITFSIFFIKSFECHETPNWSNPLLHRHHSYAKFWKRKTNTKIQIPPQRNYSLWNMYEARIKKSHTVLEIFVGTNILNKKSAIERGLIMAMHEKNWTHNGCNKGNGRIS